MRFPTTLHDRLRRAARIAAPAAALAVALALGAAGCSDHDGPTAPPGAVQFRVRVGNEQFRMRLTDPETIRLARENILGRNQKHPNGRIEPGNGGFNAPWTWHFVPDTVRMVDASIEVCDGAPSYVEAQRADYLASGYCPWGATVIAEE